MLIKRSFFITIGILIAMLIAACGSTSTTTSTGSGGAYGSGTTAGATATPTTPASTPTTASSSSAVITTATATVQGKSQTILTDASGKTLYYFTPDTATTAACTGGCASTWPPLLFTGSGSPTSSGTLSGKLSVQTDANGNQVEYNGHLLYIFSGDTAAGQTNGEGIGGKWFVASVDLALQGNGTTTSDGY